jgi:hypothetical protein
MSKVVVIGAIAGKLRILALSCWGVIVSQPRRDSIPATLSRCRAIPHRVAPGTWACLLDCTSKQHCPDRPLCDAGMHAPASPPRLDEETIHHTEPKSILWCNAANNPSSRAPARQTSTCINLCPTRIARRSIWIALNFCGNGTSILVSRQRVCTPAHALLSYDGLRKYQELAYVELSSLGNSARS